MPTKTPSVFDYTQLLAPGQSAFTDPALVKKPVGSISTQQGAEVLDKTVQQATRLAGTPPVAPPASTVKTPEAPKPTPTSVTLINPATEQSITFNEPGKDSENIQNYINSGYQMSEASGNVPSWLTPEGVSSTPETDKSKRDLEGARAALAAATRSLSNFDVSNDPQLKATLGGVTGAWDSRIADYEQAENSRIAALKTTGLRLGSQYTGGMFDGIVSAEERTKVREISSLQAQKTAALTAAQSAYENQQWGRYKDLVNLAQNVYDKQLSATSALQKAQVEQDTKLKEKQEKAILSVNIADLFSKGTTKPADILTTLRKNGDTTTTLDDISKTLTDLSPKKSAGDTFDFSQGQVSQMLAAGLSPEEIQATHDYYNGAGELPGLTPEQQAAVHDALNGTAAKKAASQVPTYAQSNPKTPGSKSYVSGDFTYTSSDLGAIQNWIAETTGPDGYSDPNAYQKAFQSWVDDGGLAKDFTKNFPPKAFINPENTWLPKYLSTHSSTATDVASQVENLFK